jgi:hypothetical protein
MDRPKTDDFQWPTTDFGRIKPQDQLVSPLRQPLTGGILEGLPSDSSWAEPTCSMLRDPRREDHTICTATAPERVFMVRT